MVRILQVMLLWMLLGYVGESVAQPLVQKKTLPVKKNPVQERVVKEEEIVTNAFAIAFYKPTYILPFYYTERPYNLIYKNNTPGNESMKNIEAKYQISFKVPLWHDILNRPATLYLGYTQLSYWQAYNHRAFFRETDYEPEIFLANNVNFKLGKNWRVNFLNIGAMHQSNGQGGPLERSWNRAYVEATLSNDHWIAQLKPWIIFHDGTYQRQNPNLGYYMGYGELLFSYKIAKNVISFQTHNLLESMGKRAGTTVSWSFPLTPYLDGYVQVFSGYGQSLIEYNHRTNSAGLGITLNNWV